jgi:hypothetical protein
MHKLLNIFDTDWAGLLSGFVGVVSLAVIMIASYVAYKQEPPPIQGIEGIVERVTIIPSACRDCFSGILVQFKSGELKTFYRSSPDNLVIGKCNKISYVVDPNVHGNVIKYVSKDCVE